MRHPLRRQLLIPVAALLVSAVLLDAVCAAWFATARQERELALRLERVADVLGAASFPRHQAVLEQLQLLTGAEFVVWDRQSVAATTLPPAAQQSLSEWNIEQLSQRRGPLSLGGREYLVAAVRQPAREPYVLGVFFAEENLSQARWQAAAPVLAVGALTIVVLVPLLWGWSQRLGLRLARVQQQVEAVAAGNYEPLADDGGADDELRRLVRAVNALSGQLRQLREQIASSERSKLLGQFAGGLAHQLRNAVAGARLAVQLHERRCPAAPQDGSLGVALRQLSLTEQQLRGMLSLGRRQPAGRVPVQPGDLTAEVVDLVGPVAEHAQVKLQSIPGASLPTLIVDQDGVRAAVLNLVLNAIEAAGAGGSVSLQAAEHDRLVEWEVRDSGPGPSAELMQHLGEPFVTGKTEGVGLGLALARQVAADHGGRLSWGRDGRFTWFRLSLPAAPVSGARA